MVTTLKVEITVREDDGRTIVKTLEGEDAERWSKYVEQETRWPLPMMQTLIGEV